jgi:hypothetical protein
MMLQSHLLAVLLACALLARVRPLTTRDWLLAIGFGVAIDLDHLLQLPFYLLSHPGASALSLRTMIHWGARWQGLMHEPYAILLVAAAALAFRSWIPLGAWALHMVQDFVIARRYVRFGSPLEWAIDAALLVALVAALEWDRRVAGADGPLWKHAASKVGIAVG